MNRMKIENMKKNRYLFMRTIGPYGIQNLHSMAKFKAWVAHHGLLDEKSIIIGIAHDNPEHTVPTACRYDTGILVSDTINVDIFLSDDVFKGLLSGGTYAVFEIEHTADAMRSAWALIFEQLSRNAFTFDASRPVVERYDAQMVKRHLCELCVPVIGSTNANAGLDLKLKI